MSPNNLPSFRFFKLYAPAQHVVHVEINRPEKLNAFCHPMWVELKAIFEFLSPNPDIRCILLSGAGDRAFTAGLDVQNASQEGPLAQGGFPDPSRKAVVLRRHILDYQNVISTVAACEKPVIALLHGYVYGLGVDLSTACDVRWSTADATFCVKEVDIGLAADVGTLSRLGKVLGGLTSFAKEVCLSARPFSADEALQNNLVSRTIPGGKQQLLSEGLKLGQLIASKSPVAVQGTKNILDASWGRTVEDNLNYTAIWNAGMLQSTDVERAMMSGLRKSKPTFEKL